MQYVNKTVEQTQSPLITRGKYFYLQILTYLNLERKKKIKEYMEKKKKKIERKKNHEEIEIKEKAEKIRENLMNLNAKSYMIMIKNPEGFKGHSKTSQFTQFNYCRPEFSLET